MKKTYDDGSASHLSSFADASSMQDFDPSLQANDCVRTLQWFVK